MAVRHAGVPGGAERRRSEEARRLSIFKANIVGYEKLYRETGVMPTADAHADRTRDEVATLSHFA